MARRSAATLAMLWILGAAAAAIAQPARQAPKGPTAKVAGGRIEVSQPIVFQIGKPGLLAPSEPVLDAVAATIRAGRPPINVQIGVHTDSMGVDAANLRMSQERADAVKAYLVGRGVPASRLEARGFGETVPIASNATADGRAKNRRVELLVVAAIAAPAPVPPPPPRSAADEARELYAKGVRAYDLGDFDQALQFFLGSFARVPAAPLLYNIAQCYRLKGERQLAIAYYEQYLATGLSGAMAERIRQQIAELRKKP